MTAPLSPEDEAGLRADSAFMTKDGGYAIFATLDAARAKEAAALAEVERLRTLVGDGIEAFRLTREYVHDDLLPAVPGWEWFDWTERARAAIAAVEADGA